MTTTGSQKLARATGVASAIVLVVVAMALAARPPADDHDPGAASAISPLSISLTPNALAVDAEGNVFIADQANQVVRKVTPDGATSVVVVGNGTEGVPTAGPATDSSLINPTGLVVDEGALYVADGGAGALLKVDGGVLSVIAGQPQPIDGPPVLPPTSGPATSSGLFTPSGVTVDDDGNLFTALAFHGVVVKISPAGQLSVVAGVPATFGRPTPGGPATHSTLFAPTDVATDGAGDLYIADSENFVVSKVDGDGVLSIVAGNGYPGVPWPGGNATTSELGTVTGLAIDGEGNLFIADPANHLVLKVDRNGQLSIVAGTGDGGPPTPGPALESDLEAPTTLAVDGEGNLFIADTINNLVLKVDAEGILSVFAGNGEKSDPSTPTIMNLPGSARPGGSFLAEVGTSSDGVRAVTSSTPDVCTASEATPDGIPVDFVAVGECLLTAEVAEGTSWVATEGTAQSLTIGPVPQCGGADVTVDLSAAEQPTDGPDVILGTDGPDAADGGGGDDLFCGRGGDDTFDGGRGRDVIRGGAGRDVSDGGPGPDRLFGWLGADELRGGGGADELVGGPGVDVLDGGPQRDVCRGGAGLDRKQSCELR